MKFRYWLPLAARCAALCARMISLASSGQWRPRAGVPSPDFRAPLFFYSQVPWDEVWQRPQELAMRLARTRRVVFFGPVQIHRLYDSLTNWRPRRRPADLKDRLLVLSPLIFPGEYKSSWIRALNRCLLNLEIRAAAGRGAGWDFLTNSPFTSYLTTDFLWRQKTFDMIDDFAAFAWAPPDGRRRQDDLVAGCDVVVTGTGALLDAIKDRRPEARFIPSGVNVALFEKALSPDTPLPEELAKWAGPVLGYTGSLSDRLDKDLLCALADRFPHALLALVGPVHGSFGAPPRRKNILYAGLRPHDQLPGWMKGFDVALIPSTLSPAALATNPIKALEYMAAGRIVVSTALPDMIRYHSDAALIAYSTDDLLRLVEEVLEGRHESLRARGRAKARLATWDETARLMMEALEGTEKR